MLRKVLFIAAMAAVSLLWLGGCKKRSSEAEPNMPVVKTMAEYEAEAKEQINEENMAAELESIEKTLEKEISEEP